jgi:hypothetical protein
MGEIRINLANPQELLEIPGLEPAMVDAILHHRAEHGPIRDAIELAKILGATLSAAALASIDFAPAAESATESAGG